MTLSFFLKSDIEFFSQKPLQIFLMCDIIKIIMGKCCYDVRLPFITNYF